MSAAAGVRTGTERPTRPSVAGARLTLLDGFRLTCEGRPVALPMSAQRLVAFLALHDRPVLRSFVAGNLWLDTSEERAHANLRSALWRLHRCDRDLVAVTGQQLSLSSAVEVDLRVAATLAHQVLRHRAADVLAREVLERATALLADDLLPDWYDDWVLMEQEQFRQIRLRALDVLCERLTCAGRLGEALEIGLTALAGEPFRESAHRAIVRIHLAEGNACEAVRQYRLCRKLLGELGVQPSVQMEELMHGVTVVDTAA